MKSKNALIALGGLLAAAFITRKKFGKSGTGKPIMKKNAIEAMIKQYRENQLAVVNKALQLDDTQSVWFELDKLKNFIAEVEKEAKASYPGISTSKLGIRFYNAAYPENASDYFSDDEVPKDFLRHHTLIMIPTVFRKGDHGELDYDFNPYGTTEGEEKTQTMSLKSAKADDSALGENHGNLVPPASGDGQSY